MPDVANQRARELWRELVASMAPADPARRPQPGELRAGYERWAEQHFPAPSELTTEIVDADGVRCLWARMPGTSRERSIVYLHGGGYMIGSAHSYRAMAAALSVAADAQVLLVDYRLAPEAPYPAALDDAATAYHWLRQTVDASEIVLGGDSAGAGLVVALLTRLRDDRETLPAAGVCVSGWFDLTLSSESLTAKANVDPIISAPMLRIMAHAYLRDQDPSTAAASPMFAELDRLPPLLLLTGTADSLFDDSIRFARRARASGTDVTLVVAEEMFHTWHLMSALLPQAEDAIAQMGRFAASAISRTDPRQP